MGFNKKYLNKENILYYLKNNDITSLVREMKLDMLFKADALIMDSWTSRFYSNLNPKEREIRKKLYEKYKFDSGYSFVNDDDYKELTSLSEALISLSGDNPQWMDIHIVIDKFKIPIDMETEAGRYKILRTKCIEAIIDHFNSPPVD